MPRAGMKVSCVSLLCIIRQIETTTMVTLHQFYYYGVSVRGLGVLSCTLSSWGEHRHVIPKRHVYKLGQSANIHVSLYSIFLYSLLMHVY